MAQEMPVVVAEAEERRAALGEALEVREADDSMTIGGYAAVFNKETVIGGLWGFREKIAAQAFNEAVVNDDVRALFNHNPDILLGRTSSGTLTLTVDKRGLRYDVELPDTSAARDVRTLIKRGDVTGSSFAFKVIEDEWDESEVKAGKLPLRTIRKAELFDVSPVTYPAYPQTTVSARSKAQAVQEAVQRQAEAVEAQKTPDRRAIEQEWATLEAALDEARR